MGFSCPAKKSTKRMRLKRGVSGVLPHTDSSLLRISPALGSCVSGNEETDT